MGTGHMGFNGISKHRRIQVQQVFFGLCINNGIHIVIIGLECGHILCIETDVIALVLQCFCRGIKVGNPVSFSNAQSRSFEHARSGQNTHDTVGRGHSHVIVAVNRNSGLAAKAGQ